MIYMDKCVGCKACMLACSVAKEKVFDCALSRIQVKKDEDTCLGIPFVCINCENPPCRGACPTKAISKDPKTGIISVDLDLCSGCGACQEACPYKAVVMNAKRNVALICDLCGGNPACAKVCSPQAIQYVEAEGKMVVEKMREAKKRVKTLVTLEVT